MLRRRWIRAERRRHRPRLPLFPPSRNTSPRRAPRRLRRSLRRRNRSPIPRVEVRMDPTSVAIAPPARKTPARSLAGLLLGEILVAQGAVGSDKLEEALQAQAERGGRIGELLVSLKACSEEQVLKGLAAQLELPYQLRIGTEDIAPDLVAKVPINFAKQARILPLRADTDHVVVAVADPLDTGALDSVRMLLGTSVSPLLVPTQSILDCINSVYDRAHNEAE